MTIRPANPCAAGDDVRAQPVYGARMDTPRVSVICAFLDGERFLAEAIESVVAQDFADFELILVDDGSAPPASAIAQGYARERPGQVRYIDHPGHANIGAAAARNVGVAAARGQLLAFIDADDRWRAGKLAEQAALLDAHPRAGMVCGSANYWRSWDGGSDAVVDLGVSPGSELAPPAAALALHPLGAGNAPCPSEIMIRRALVEAIGGFEEAFTGHLQMYEDQAFLVKAYLAAPVLCTDRVWLDYRIHDASCMARGARAGKEAAARRYFLDWLEGYLAGRDVPAPQRLEAALRRARWQLDHPFAARVLRRLARSG